MVTSKIIPLSTLIIDTKKGTIQLKKEETILDITGINFKNSKSKFSRIDIHNGIGTMFKSSSDSSLVNIFMTNVYNLIYDKFKNSKDNTKHEEILQKLFRNISDTLKENR